jgi:hypothetical protein
MTSEFAEIHADVIRWLSESFQVAGSGRSSDFRTLSLRVTRLFSSAVNRPRGARVLRQRSLPSGRARALRLRRAEGWAREARS